jgi:hypothetical protein
MPLTYEDWNAIMEFVGKEIGRRTGFFEQGKVIRRDTQRKLIWLEEFGDQPIPVIGFDQEVKLYTKTSVQRLKATPLTPKVGDTVLVAKHMGTRRLPKCLGVVQGYDYVLSEE